MRKSKENWRLSVPSSLPPQGDRVTERSSRALIDWPQVGHSRPRSARWGSGPRSIGRQWQRNERLLSCEGETALTGTRTQPWCWLIALFKRGYRKPPSEYTQKAACVFFFFEIFRRCIPQQGVALPIGFSRPFAKCRRHRCRRHIKYLSLYYKEFSSPPVFGKSGLAASLI